jgi:hypothetical protein
MNADRQPCRKVGFEPHPVLEFLHNLQATHTAWRNCFLGIDSWAPQKFKNSGPGLCEVHLIPAPEEGEWRESQPAADVLHAHPLIVGEDGARGHATRPRLTSRPRHQPVKVLHFVTLESSDCGSVTFW